MFQPQKYKNITILNFLTTLHDFALKMETGQFQNTILKITNANDKCESVCNGIRAYNCLVGKRTLNHLAKLAK